MIIKETGSIFTIPNGFTWEELGAYVGAPTTTTFARMSPESLKISHGRFQHFMPADNSTWAWFPHSALKQYEAAEIAAGRAPIFVTATYAGKKRPVLYAWSLGLNNGVPTAPVTNWRQAVNTADDRYVRFWIDKYARPVLWGRYTALQNMAIGLDECAFNPGLYGVLDDSGRFVADVRWDVPFPQNELAYMQMIDQFFVKVHQLAPDIRMVINIGSPKSWSLWNTATAHVDGLMQEEIFDGTGTTAYLRGKTYNTWTATTSILARGGIGVMRTFIPTGDAVRAKTSYMVYLLLKGVNSYFAPTIKGSSPPTAVPPGIFAGMRELLGEPVAPMQSVQHGANINYRLYSRQYERGIVYVNLTGGPFTVPLPTDEIYLDAAGNEITSLTIPDMNGDYVIRVSPKVEIGIVSTARLTLDRTARQDVTVGYTVERDGSDPTSGSVTIRAGEQSADLPLPDDTRLTVRIGSATGAELGVNAALQITISAPSGAEV